VCNLELILGKLQKRIVLEGVRQEDQTRIREVLFLIDELKEQNAPWQKGWVNMQAA
jgi:hypothetical protein